LKITDMISRALSFPKLTSVEIAGNHETRPGETVVTVSPGVELQTSRAARGTVKHCEWSWNQSVPAASDLLGNGKQDAFMYYESKRSFDALANLDSGGVQ
jgi:hypothetical protein